MTNHDHPGIREGRFQRPQVENLVNVLDDMPQATHAQIRAEYIRRHGADVWPQFNEQEIDFLLDAVIRTKPAPLGRIKENKMDGSLGGAQRAGRLGDLGRPYDEKTAGCAEQSPSHAIGELERMANLAMEGERQLDSLRVLIDQVHALVHGPSPKATKDECRPPFSPALGLVELRRRFEQTHQDREANLHRLHGLLGAGR